MWVKWKIQQRMELNQHITALPAPTAKNILTLYYLGENSIDEIADITGIKAANIKMKLHRARKKMLAILKKTLKSELQYIV